MGPVFIYADAQLLPGKPAALRRDQISSLSWEDRAYEWRQEAETHFNISEHPEEHDVFAAFGD